MIIYLLVTTMIIYLLVITMIIYLLVNHVPVYTEFHLLSHFGRCGTIHCQQHFCVGCPSLEEATALFCISWTSFMQISVHSLMRTSLLLLSRVQTVEQQNFFIMCFLSVSHHYSGTPLNGHRWYNGQFWKSRLSFHSFQYLSNPWIVDTLLLCITDSFHGPKCTQAILNDPD